MPDSLCSRHAASSVGLSTVAGSQLWRIEGCHLIAKGFGLVVVLPDQAPVLLQAAAVKAVLLPVA